MIEQALRTKYCPRCRSLKPCGEFGKCSYYGLQSYCKSCKKQWSWLKNNPLETRIATANRQIDRLMIFANAQHIEEPDLAWSAGFFDAEGSISLWRQPSRYTDYTGLRPGVNAKQNNPLALTKLQQLFNGTITKDKNTRCHTWKLTKIFDMVRFLSLVMPYLHVKKKEAMILLDFIHNYQYPKWKVDSRAAANREKMRNELDKAKKLDECKHSDIEHDAWYAGFFDGDGHISLNSNGSTIAIRTGVSQKIESPVQRFQKRFGGSVHTRYRYKKRSLLADWYLCKKSSIQQYLITIGPYLHCKKGHQKVAESFLSLGKITHDKISSASKLMTEMKSLNK